MFQSPEFWVAVSFLLLLAFIARPLVRFIVNALDERSARIQRELGEALKLKEEAQALLSSYQRRRQEAIEEANKIIAHAEDEAKRLAKEAEHALEESLNRRIEMAMQKIANYEAAVLQEVRTNAVDIAVGAVRALVVEHLGKESAEGLIKGAVQDINRKLH